tara:strand:- start:181 stop:447 length:267 start_codon:yes stop_codon:yes gene_type:complete
MRAFFTVKLILPIILFSYIIPDRKDNKKMTRKHFKELAKILNENKASKELVKDVILFCKTQNSNFDSFRFIDACGFIILNNGDFKRLD